MRDHKNGKKTVFKNRFDQLKADSKSRWRVINEAIRPNSSKYNSFKLTLPDGSTECPTKIAKAFNEHFTSVAPNLPRNLPSTNIDPNRSHYLQALISLYHPLLLCIVILVHFILLFTFL